MTLLLAVEKSKILSQMILCEQVCVLVRCIVCERLRWSLYQRYEGRDNIVIGHVVSET